VRALQSPRRDHAAPSPGICHESQRAIVSDFPPLDHPRHSGGAHCLCAGQIPFISGHGFATLGISYLLLLAGNMFKGL
jgi:hypothetical protein